MPVPAIAVRSADVPGAPDTPDVPDCVDRDGPADGFSAMGPETATKLPSISA
jgi:hypothetical protein